MPDFYYIAEEVKRSEGVMLHLGFWFWDPDAEGLYFVAGHLVTVAGVNSKELMIALSDPAWDQIPAASPSEHNDAEIVSHDIYHVNLTFPYPRGTWWIPDYWAWWEYENMFHAQNVPPEFEKYHTKKGQLRRAAEYYTTVEYAVIT